MPFLRRTKDNEVSLTVTTANFFRLAALTIFTVLLLHAVQKASHALLLIFTAFFLALALNGPVYWISRHLPGKPRDNRSLATILSFLIVILLLGGFIASIAPPLVRQTEGFVSAAPKIIKDFRSQDSETGKIIRRYHLEKQVSDVSTQLSGKLKNIGGSAFTTLSKVGSSIFSTLTILVLTFMILVEGPRWLGFFKEVLPEKYHERADRLALDMYKVVKGYVNGQVTLAAIAACLLLPALLVLHVGYPVALMVIVFICGLIPMIGHTIGAVIVTTVALFHSTGSAVIILAYYILYQQVENYLIQPRIQANSTNMSPLLVFSSVVVGVSFSGLFGGLVAIPIAGCIRIVILDFLRMKNIISQPELKRVTTETK